MTTAQADEEQSWLAVIGRSLAFLCLHVGELRSKELTGQAAFLKRLGLSRREVAKILGTSEGSLRVLESRAQKAKGAKRGKTKQNK